MSGLIGELLVRAAEPLLADARAQARGSGGAALLGVAPMTGGVRAAAGRGRRAG